MTPAKDRPFWDLDEADMSGLAQFLNATLAAAPDELAIVEENLRVLLGHAKILAAALPQGARAAPAGDFEP